MQSRRTNKFCRVLPPIFCNSVAITLSGGKHTTALETGVVIESRMRLDQIARLIGNRIVPVR